MRMRKGWKKFLGLVLLFLLLSSVDTGFFFLKKFLGFVLLLFVVFEMHY